VTTSSISSWPGVFFGGAGFRAGNARPAICAQRARRSARAERLSIRLSPAASNPASRASASPLSPVAPAKNPSSASPSAPASMASSSSAVGSSATVPADAASASANAPPRLMTSTMVAQMCLQVPGPS
jgi:hypothetical protein